MEESKTINQFTIQVFESPEDNLGGQQTFREGEREGIISEAAQAGCRFLPRYRGGDNPQVSTSYNANKRLSAKAS